MPLNKALVGKEYPPTTTEATLDAMQNYARAYNDDNPAFFFVSRPGGIVAPPMYAVVVTWASIMGVVGDTDLKVDVVRLLHGEQDMEFLRPIRPGDKISSIAKVASIETKASGETLVIEINAKNQAGETRAIARCSTPSFAAAARAARSERLPNRSAASR